MSYFAFIFLRSHLSMLYGVATKHYIKASKQFHNNFVTAPSLFLFSKNDPVGTSEGNLQVIKCWEDRGIQVYAKCWESSRHVSHFHLYPEEYMKELAAFLDKIGLLTVPLEDIKNIHRASKLWDSWLATCLQFLTPLTSSALKRFFS